MKRLLTSTRGIINSATIFILLVCSIASAIILPYKQMAYAHTFTGDESASFLSVIKILQAEANLVQSNLVSNATLAQDHAKSIVDVVNGNHAFGVLPDEVSENNKRVAANVVHTADALQTVVKSRPTPTQTDLKTKVDNLNATLQEAVAVRLPKDAPSNSTINGLATKNLVNETLRQYGYAFGVANVKGGSSNNETAKSSDPGSAATIMNMSAYQSAQALASQTQGMLFQAKSVVPANATSATKAAIATVATDLSQLKSTTDEKDPYDKVASLVQKTIYPDIDAAFHLR
ncbi:MAG: hypothetical protein WBZ36_17895 [Candidatus Nitrosopolaris sp.]